MGWIDVCIEGFCSIIDKSIYWPINQSVVKLTRHATHELLSLLVFCQDRL